MRLDRSNRPIGIALTLLSIACSVPAAGCKTAPADPLRRVAPDLGFTLRVPSVAWECVHPGKHGYQCLPKGGDPVVSAFSVMVSEPDSEVFNRDEFVRGSLAAAKEKGWRTHTPIVEASEIPFPGATHFTYLEEPSEQGPTYMFAAYVGRDKAGRLLTIMHFFRGTEEPKDFRNFVASYLSSES